MSFPSFFDQAPSIRLRDPLAAFLGAAEDGVIHYTYTDVVKLAGHSCPTVAGAYLMTVKALQTLYGEDLPERGAIKVIFGERSTDGVTGVIANVVSFLTGATTDTGFKGLRGHFDRRNLLAFEQPLEGQISFQRIDTGAQVSVTFNSAIVPPPPGLFPSLLHALEGPATPEEKQAFATLWQDRVQQIFEQADNPELVTIRMQA